MPTYSRAGLAGAVLLAAGLSAATAAPAPPTPTDPFGDPLPPGVLARLGTPRLRHTCSALEWAPDGQTLASAGWDGTVRVWDAASGKEVRRCKGLPTSIRAMTILPDGKTAATQGGENTLRVWDLAAGREVRTFFPAPFQGVALAPGPEEGTLVELSADAVVHVWDLTAGKEGRPVELSRGKQPTAVALSADGRRVAGWLAQADALTVWDASTGKELFQGPTKLTNLVGLAFSPDAKTLAASGAPGQVVTWDAESGKELRRYEDTGSLHWLTFTPGGGSVAGLGVGPAIHLWDLASGKEVRKFQPPAPFGPSWWGPGALAFSPDGKTLAASQGAAIHLWDVDTGRRHHRFAGHTGAVEDVRFTAGGSHVLTCGGDATVRLWELSPAKEVASWANTQGAPYAMAAGPDGKSVVASLPHGWVRVELGDEKPSESALSGAAPAVGSGVKLTPSGDGTTLLGTGGDLKIHLYDAETGKEIGPLPIPAHAFGAAALSPDGKLLAEGNATAAPLHLWDVTTGKDIRAIGEAMPPGQSRQTVGLCFSPDGKGLLHVRPGELNLFEVAGGGERVRMTRPSGPFGSGPFAPDGTLVRAIFSPDGETLAAGTSVGTVLLLDAKTGRELTRLTGHTNGVTCLAFSSDGAMLAAGCVDGLALVWDVKEWTGRPRPAAAELKPEKLSALWENLHDADAGKAYKAILALASSPATSAAYLKERLTAAGDPRSAPLIHNLNDDDPEVRDKAQKDLADMAGSAVSALRHALAADPPPESRRRMQELLDHYKSGGVSEEVRELRALEALERSGSTETLRALAKEAPDSLVKREAAAALRRLAPHGTDQ